MTAIRIRPRLEAVEDRLAPAASTADVLAAYGRSGVFSEGLQYIISALEFNPPAAVRTAVGRVLVQGGAQATADAHTLNDYATMLQQNAAAYPAGAAVAVTLNLAAARDFFAGAVATNIGNIFGVSPPPPPASPPPPPAPVVPTSGATDNSGLSGVSVGPSDPRFQTQASGIKTIDEVVGTGATVPASASVQVFYTGFLANGTNAGTVFDTNRTNSTPATFTIPSGVITGFADGLVGMKVGGIRDIFIPSTLGYGATGSGTSIPPNSDLIFQVKVVGVTPTSTTGTTTTGG